MSKLSDIRDLFLNYSTCPPAFWGNKPLSLHPEWLSEETRELLAELKSDDIENDNWHLR